MAFCFKRKESVAKGIRRLGRERIESALDCLKDCARAEAIHCARKDIKRIRALLRMVRANIAKKDFRRLTRLLRGVARHLAAPRDAYVKAKTLKRLSGHFKGQLTNGALRHVRSNLHRVAEHEMKRFAAEKVRGAVERQLSKIAKEIERLDIDAKGWSAIGPGVKSVYSQGRLDCKAAMKDPSPENLHQWRKRAKDLWYQVSLLHPVWPEQMDAMAGELETLGEYLGDDHDLFVLKESLQERTVRDGERREVEMLRALINERQHELHVAALALGKRLYADKPSVFCERLAGYWHIWRRERKSLRVV